MNFREHIFCYPIKAVAYFLPAIFPNNCAVIKEDLHPNQKLAFLCYISKLIYTFLKNKICILY